MMLELKCLIAEFAFELAQFGTGVVAKHVSL